MKDLFTRYTNDVIATSAFGIGCDSLNNPKNEFYEMGKTVTNFRGVRALIFFGYMMSPKLMKVRMSFLYPQYSWNAVKHLYVKALFLPPAQPALHMFNNFTLSLSNLCMAEDSHALDVTPCHWVSGSWHFKPW
jgi:hypothetical protein